MKSRTKQSLMKRVNSQSSFTTTCKPSDTGTSYQLLHRTIWQHLSMREKKRLALYALLILLLMPRAAAQIYTVTDLGTLGGSESLGTGINDLGQVVGESTTGCDPSSERPFLWTKADGMQDLGAPPGVFGGLTAINTFGQVVGTFCLQPCSGSEHGFIWTKATGWLDLNDLIPADSGWVLVVPFDINAWGRITGYGLINGQVHAFLLTPNILRR